MKNIIVFLTVRPTLEYYNLCKKLLNVNYSMYICIDDNSYEIPEYDNIIDIIKIDNEECEDAGFKDSVIMFRHKCCSRDKALYYFYKNNVEYDNIWFLEEDVFVPTPLTIHNIDAKYGNADDLLVSSHEIYDKNTISDWHWPHVKNTIMLPLPWAKAMVCAIRISKKMMELIYEYATKHKTLFMDESLFNTIALYNNLMINVIPELSTITYRDKWILDDILLQNLYHPIKNIGTQTIFQKMIDGNNSHMRNVNIMERIHIKHLSLINSLSVSKNTLSSTNFNDKINKIYFKINALDNIIAHYGTDDYKVNVTDKFINNFKKNNKIIITKGTSFNTYLGDPCPGYFKKLFLKIDDVEFIIDENYALRNLEFDINISSCIDMNCNNILVYYETNDVKIDMTDIFSEELNKYNYIKKIFQNTLYTEYISDEKNINQKLTTNINNITAYYGTDSNKINITNIIIDKFIQNNKIIILKTDSFNEYFGDPFFGQSKKLFLKIDTTEYIINEDHSSSDLEFNLSK